MKTNFTSLAAMQSADYLLSKGNMAKVPTSKSITARPRLFGTPRYDKRPQQPTCYVQTGNAWQTRIAEKPAVHAAKASASDDLKYFDIFASIVSLTQEFTPPADAATPPSGVAESNTSRQQAQD